MPTSSSKTAPRSPLPLLPPPPRIAALRGGVGAAAESRRAPGLDVRAHPEPRGRGEAHRGWRTPPRQGPARARATRVLRGGGERGLARLGGPPMGESRARRGARSLRGEGPPSHARPGIVRCRALRPRDPPRARPDVSPPADDRRRARRARPRQRRDARRPRRRRVPVLARPERHRAHPRRVRAPDGGWPRVRRVGVARVCDAVSRRARAPRRASTFGVARHARRRRVSLLRPPRRGRIREDVPLTRGGADRRSESARGARSRPAETRDDGDVRRRRAKTQSARGGARRGRRVPTRQTRPAGTLRVRARPRRDVSTPDAPGSETPRGGARAPREPRGGGDCQDEGVDRAETRRHGRVLRTRRGGAESERSEGRESGGRGEDGEDGEDGGDGGDGGGGDAGGRGGRANTRRGDGERRG